MTEDLCRFVQRILESPIWEAFRLIRAQAPVPGNIFTFSEYLAALALLLVVMIASDFRFRYRLSLTRTDLRKVGFWVGLSVGAAILGIDVWFQNGFPIPRVMANPNNLTAALGLVFLAFVFWVISVAVIRPPAFSKGTAKQFFESNYHFIHEGNADRLQVIAEELRRSLRAIVTIATKLSIVRDGHYSKRTPSEAAHAYDLLLLFADRRFCKVVVDKIPAFAFGLVQEVDNPLAKKLPIFPFVRNIGQEFIGNKQSSLYQERSGYYSGLLGLERPATKLLFGSYEFVEACANQGGSPLDIDYRDFVEFDEQQMEGFTRAALSFLNSYLKTTGGCYYSQALSTILKSFESSLHRVHEINGVESYRTTKAYIHLDATVRFIGEAVALVEKYATIPKTFRTRSSNSRNIFDDLAVLIFRTIVAASTVSSPAWTAWAVQRNAVWFPIFNYSDSITRKIVAFKVRRLLYDEIKKMDRFANFMGARLLGFCLNVLGLTLTDRHRGFQHEFFPLQAASVGWIKANYKTLLIEHPKVAEACLQGWISYDSDNQRLIQTYRDNFGKEPQREFLYLD